MTIFIPVKQGTQEWLDLRSGACTASRFCEAIDRIDILDNRQAAYVEAIRAGCDPKTAMARAGYKAAPSAKSIDAVLAGASRFKPSAKSVTYACLLALERIAKQPLDETFVTWKMQRGQELEPDARIAYEVKTGRMVLETGIAFTDDRVFAYSSDGLVDDDGLVEIKCPASPEKLHLAWTNPAELALDYIDQINGGLWITGRRWCDLIVYCPWLRSVGKELMVHRIERDEAAIDDLEDRLVAFARSVQAREIDFRRPTVGSAPAIEEASPTLIDQPLGALSSVVAVPSPINGLPARTADDPAACRAPRELDLLPSEIPF